MKNYYFLILLVILNILLLTASTKKKKKVDKKPASVSQELFCNSCQAIIQEVLKKIRESKKESDVIDALDHLCDMKNFYVYEYPPPEMRKGCEAFYAAYYDKLESELIKRIDNQSIQERICNKVTKVCVGVDFEAVKQESIRKQKEEALRKQQKEEERKQEQEEEEKKLQEENKQSEQNIPEEINLNNTDKQEEL